MKLNAKVAIALVAASVSVFGLATQAQAGEGAAAGSAAFSLNGGNVTGAAVSAAVGKNDAAATATNSTLTVLGVPIGAINTATALGSAGVVNVTGDARNGGIVTNIRGTVDTGLAQQNNTLSAPLTVNLGTTGTVQVISPLVPPQRN